MAFTLAKYLQENRFNWFEPDLEYLRNFVNQVNQQASKIKPMVIEGNNPLKVSIQVYNLVKAWVEGKRKDELKIKIPDGLTRAEAIEAQHLFEQCLPTIRMYLIDAHGYPTEFKHPYLHELEDGLVLYDKPYLWGSYNSDSPISTNMSVKVSWSKTPYTLEMAQKDVIYSTLGYAQVYSGANASNIGIILPRQNLIRTLYIGNLAIFKCEDMLEEFWHQLKREAINNMELYSLRLSETY